jgi:hypothetical protein
MPTDDEPDLLGPARELLVTALRLGKKANDSGDSLGCFELCACAVRLARKIKGLSEVADFRLEQSLDRASDETEPTTQAEVMCEAIEALLEGEDEEKADTVSIPDHPLAAMQAIIEMAISIGAPAYNTGDHQGCYDVYACTARMLLAVIAGEDAAKNKLREALNACAKLDDPNQQAWTMRHAFDAIGEMGEGPTLSPQEVQLHLSFAIRIGVPAYNAGDHRGCYEVYACAARFLVNASSIPDKVKDTLRTALERASSIQNVSRQAWVIREAFDSLLPKSDEPDDSPGS